MVNKKIEISYIPLCGGRFLSQTLNCSDSFDGTSYVDTIKKDYADIKKKSNWHQTEYKRINPNIFCETSNTFNFKYYKENQNNLIFITIENRKDIEIIEKRRVYINTTGMEDSWDILMKYHYELIDFLQRIKKKIYTIPVHKIFNLKNYIEETNNVLTFYNYKTISNDLLTELHRSWSKANILFSLETKKHQLNKGFRNNRKNFGITKKY